MSKIKFLIQNLLPIKVFQKTTFCILDHKNKKESKCFRPQLLYIFKLIIYLSMAETTAAAAAEHNIA